MPLQIVDDAATVLLFVVSAVAMAYPVVVGLFYVLIEHQATEEPPRRRLHVFVQVLALAVPPILVFGIFGSAIVLACFASGVTFYYPLIALAAGFAAWYCSVYGISNWLKNLLSAHKAAHVRVRPDSLTAEEAVTAVREYLRSNQIDYPTEGLVAERFPLGWSVYAPVTVDTGDPMAFLDMPVERALFLVGDSGRIEQTSSSTPPEHARVRFTALESGIANSRIRWVRRDGAASSGGRS